MLRSGGVVTSEVPAGCATLRGVRDQASGRIAAQVSVRTVLQGRDRQRVNLNGAPPQAEDRGQAAAALPSHGRLEGRHARPPTSSAQLAGRE